RASRLALGCVLTIRPRVCSPFLFFFQAEDGIRDWSVTGVQTCALPILQAADRQRGRPWAAPAGRERPAADQRRLPAEQVLNPVRSEERRVGKEWRSRGAAGR